MSVEYDAAKLIGDNLDVKVSTRAPASEYDTELDANMSTRSKPADFMHKTLFYSDVQAIVTLPAVAGSQALPSVTIPTGGLPSGATIDKVYCHIRCRTMRDSSGGDNKINGDQYVQVKESVGGSYRNAIKVVDDSLFIDFSEGIVVAGFTIYGNIEASDEVAAVNKTYNFQWTSARVDGASMLLDDVQMIIEVRWH